MSASLDRYERWMLDRGDKQRSVANVICALRPMLDDVLDVAVTSVTPTRARQLYDGYRQTTTRLGAKPSAATHRHTLKLARALGAWWVDIGWTRRNPFARVYPVGKPRRGKAQLRATEALAFSAAAKSAVDGGDYRALAPLVGLYLGLRPGEVVGLTARDVDAGGRLLWIARSATKTDAGERRLGVEPAWLADMLAARATEVAPGRLFPHRPAWVTAQTEMVCAAAGVPRITGHGLRGTHTSLAETHGATASAVAASLGHVSTDTAAQHYAAPGVREDAARRRMLQVLDGGLVGDGNPTVSVTVTKRASDGQ